MGGRGANSMARLSAGVQYRAKSNSDSEPLTLYIPPEDKGTTRDKGDYTANGNEALIAYQRSGENEAAKILERANDYDLSEAQYMDGWAFHDIPLNKLLLNLGISGSPTVMSEAEFEAYIQQSGESVLYRGWSGYGAADRFMNAPYNHVGSGCWGDGYYVTKQETGAKMYGDVVTKMALSPNARVVSLADVQAEIKKANPDFGWELYRAGSSGSGGRYGTNSGEAQMALRMGYNVIDIGHKMYVGITSDAFVVSEKIL